MRLNKADERGKLLNNTETEAYPAYNASNDFNTFNLYALYILHTHIRTVPLTRLQYACHWDGDKKISLTLTVPKK